MQDMVVALIFNLAMHLDFEDVHIIRMRLHAILSLVAKHFNHILNSWNASFCMGCGTGSR